MSKLRITGKNETHGRIITGEPYKTRVLQEGFTLCCLKGFATREWGRPSSVEEVPVSAWREVADQRVFVV